MSMPATDDWFSLSARRNRKSFILANLGLLLTFAVILVALGFFEAQGRAGQILFLIFFIPFVLAGYSLTAQRLRDFGVTGWLALLWIPIAMLPEPASLALSLAFWIVLCSVPGTVGPNRWGDDPLD
jgi:uncharacterized membrane protein YhaH (DUF805 family)